jgi:hypothetical protein
VDKSWSPLRLIREAIPVGGGLENLSGVQDAKDSYKSPGRPDAEVRSRIFYRGQSQCALALHAVFCRRTIRDFYHARNATVRNEHEPRADLWLGISRQLPGCLWVYFLAPTLGMLDAADLFLLVRGGVGPYCAKLHHANDKRCIFRQGVQQVRP